VVLSGTRLKPETARLWLHRRWHGLGICATGEEHPRSPDRDPSNQSRVAHSPSTAVPQVLASEAAKGICGVGVRAMMNDG